ncbi:unnamed protein product [Commensalibacter communis]|uniref:DUF2635 domain-containing protein n=1 Tax=Commensalibacter communis TaxID=2972786 RepID=A0A9W4TQ29_9PROT|nr:DUF2635 domain-containing protein [Commensalibacter communis]CAI3953508.1 unnamed protein product [Commensalibacter communis]CAI3956577.1 unnamed protein product [Commensalibacter communis]CAI3956701.1 unnamed protein product [Commensalibacter communis]CAI3957082.1 unnamed protein product [Commensalibacter communis]
MFVKPALGRKVRWPVTMRALSDQGEDVPDNFYWQQAIQTGDVILMAQDIVEGKKPSTAVVKKGDQDG